MLPEFPARLDDLLLAREPGFAYALVTVRQRLLEPEDVIAKKKPLLELRWIINDITRGK